jgi:hypothetical protein
MAVYEALSNLNNHPTAEKVKEYVVKNILILPLAQSI